MSDWFGKGCKYLVASWEDDERVAGPDWKEAKPALVFCKHSNNHEFSEGNCNHIDCPLGYNRNSFIKEFELKDPLPGTMFSLWKENIHKMLIKSKGLCPCVNDPQLQGPDTQCQCKEYRDSLICKCNLYVKDSM